MHDCEDNIVDPDENSLNIQIGTVKVVHVQEQIKLIRMFVKMTPEECAECCDEVEKKVNELTDRALVYLKREGFVKSDKGWNKQYKLVDK